MDIQSINSLCKPIKLQQYGIKMQHFPLRSVQRCVVFSLRIIPYSSTSYFTQLRREQYRPPHYLLPPAFSARTHFLQQTRILQQLVAILEFAENTFADQLFYIQQISPVGQDQRRYHVFMAQLNMLTSHIKFSCMLSVTVQNKNIFFCPVQQGINFDQ